MRAALMLELGDPDTTKKFKLLEILRTFSIGSPQSKSCWFEKRSLVGVTCDNAGKSSSTSVLATATMEFLPESEQIRSCADCVGTVIRGSSFAYTIDQLPSPISRPTHGHLSPAIHALT